VGYEGQLVFDTTKPDGTPRKLMDTSKINQLGWKSSIDLRSGLKKTINEVDSIF
jgi:GDP-L-fucose synthase